MSIIKKIIFFSIFVSIISISNIFAENLKKVGKFKDWEVMIMSEASGKDVLLNLRLFYRHQNRIKEMLDYL